MENERYSLERAQEEAAKLQKKVETGEASTYGEAERQIESKLEIELSPEQIEAIMKKVQDINAEGTAFTNMGGNPEKPGHREEIVHIFKEGLLGTPHGSQGGWDEGSRTSDSIKSSWAKNIRTKKRGTVHFNIVGRIRENDKGEFKMHKSHYVGDNSGGKGFNKYPTNKIGLIFDISKYREVPYSHDKPEQNRTIKPNDHGVFRSMEHYDHDPETLRYRGYIDEQGRMIPSEEYGFVASFRIPSRNFRGIIFNAVEKLTEEEINREPDEFNRNVWRLNPYAFGSYGNEIVRQKRVAEIRDMMLEAYGQKPELLMPIYDTRGNLYWPKRMSYEEVRKLVDDRKSKV